MSKRLDEVIETPKPDNLFAGIQDAEVFSVSLAGGQGILKRGTVLALNNGAYSVLGTATTGKANAILSDDVDTGLGDSAKEDTVNAVAYRTGHFNGNVLITEDEYEITAADKEALRVAGILLSDAV